MRHTQSTIVAATCVIIALTAFWPDSNEALISRGNAQVARHQKNCTTPQLVSSSAPETTSAESKPADPFHNSRQAVEAKLAQPCGAEFFQMPLREVLADLSAQWEISIIFDAEELGDVIDPDVPIDVQVRPDAMSGRTLLNKLILAPHDLVFTVHENYLLVSSYDKSLTMYETVVYDCQDLLTAMTKGKTTSEGISCEKQLINVIWQSIRTEDSPWDDGGNSVGVGTDENVGSIAAIDGLLVIRQTQAIHEQIKDLLSQLRESLAKRTASTTAHH